MSIGKHGGNLTKRCSECGNEIHKHSNNMCIECKEEQENKNRMPIAPYPTCALPGSTKKILVLSWRVLNSYNLWHPNDITYEDLLTDKWLNPTLEQEEFEQKILAEIRQVLENLTIKIEAIYEKRKLFIKRKLKSV